MTAAADDLSAVSWHRRLGARVAGGVSLLVICSLGAAVFATTRAVTSRSLARSSNDLEVAHAAFNQSLDTRATAVTALTRLVTALPIFRAHLTDGRLSTDVATMTAMVDDYRQQLGAEFSVVTDRRGVWLASPGWPRTALPPASLASAVERATLGQSRRGVIPIDGQLFLVISEPARFSEEILGTLTVGYVLDDAVA